MFIAKHHLRGRLVTSSMVCILVFTAFVLQLTTNTIVSHAQTNNTTIWDFEDGDFSDWTTTGQVQVVSASIDQLTNGHMTNVAQGQYSLRVGDDVPWRYAGEQTSTVIQNMVVPQAGGKPVLQFSYAVVANDPPAHPEIDKPFFHIEVRDLTRGDVLPVGDFKYTDQLSQEWFLGGAPNDQGLSQIGFSRLSGDRWVFIPWKHEVVDLSDRIGNQIQLVFTVRDCNPTAHAAYGYLDNISIGGEVTPPSLPALLGQPIAAGPPPAPSITQQSATWLERYALWPWCLLLPFLALLALCIWWLRRPRVIAATEESLSTRRQTRREQRDPIRRDSDAGAANWRNPGSRSSNDRDAGGSSQR
jgi:hypothetical protein